MEEKKNNSRLIYRRGVLGGFCALGLGLPVLTCAADVDTDVASLAPQENDLLVFAYGEREGRQIAVDDLQIDQEQIFSFPMEPDTAVIRNATRLNQIILVRLDPARLSKQTAARSVDGIVAYSSVCTHTGCDITDWNDEFNRFQCPCHESQFDPSDGARVVGGPAPWQLAALPLKLNHGFLAVAREFEGRVGFPQPGQSPFGF